LAAEFQTTPLSRFDILRHPPIRFQGGPPKQLTDFKSDSIFDFAWSRDGKWLALSHGRISRDVVLLTDTTNTKQANSD
jgi:hypothetical protein